MEEAHLIRYKDWMLTKAFNVEYLDKSGFAIDLWELLKYVYDEVEKDGYVKNCWKIHGGIKPQLTPKGYVFYYTGGYSGEAKKIKMDKLLSNILNTGKHITKEFLTAAINTAFSKI